MSLLFLFNAVAPIMAAAPEPTVADLELQVVALNTLYEMQLTPQQTQSIKKLGADSVTTAMPSDAAPDPDYRLTLVDLRSALLAQDQEKIFTTQKRLEDLRRILHIVPSAKVIVTEEAKKNAGAAIQVLNSGQIADYIAIHSSEVRDATEPILDALDQCRNLPDNDAFDRLCHEASEDADFLIEGYSGRGTAATTKKVTALLTKARKMSDATFNAQRSKQLDDQARAIVPDHFVSLRHWLEGQMACLLSNPQLNSN
jgi:hypothetical protein